MDKGYSVRNSLTCAIILLLLAVSVTADTQVFTNLSNVSAISNITPTTVPYPGLNSQIITTLTVIPGNNQLNPLPVNTTPPYQTSNKTKPSQPPPILLLNNPEIQGLNVTVNGIASAGSPANGILDIKWNWGDSETLESHSFPSAHTYTTGGQYQVGITAYQSDGQAFSRELSVNVSAPQTVNPTPPVPAQVMQVSQLPPPPAGTPAVTLFSPEIVRLNVTINGYTDPGIQNATIRTLSIDWGDGTTGNYSTLPGTHTYATSGLYTVNITAVRSDGEKATRNIGFEVQDTGPGPTVPPEGGGDGLLFMFIVVVTLLAVFVVGGVVQRIIHKRDEKLSPDLPKSVARLAESYYLAKERGDTTAARENAEASAALLRTLAETNPDNRPLYLEKAALWETIAGNIGRSPGIRENGVVPPDKSADTGISPEEYEKICSGTDVTPEVLDAVVRIALEIAHEGREGKPVGTSFIIGDTRAVMDQSRQFVLNPFFGHQEAERWITDEWMRENIKEFAQLDGAFIITGKGLVEAAGRNITVDTSNVKIPAGMGARHASAAGITLVTKSIGVVVSQSGGRITLIKGGEFFRTI
jgi:hypothetical protein